MAHGFHSVGEIVENGFCIGCGLCQALAPSAAIEMREAANGHLRPHPAAPIPEVEHAAILRLCPGININGPFPAPEPADPVWGTALRVARGHATDRQVRFEAAAGGMMTALSQHLVESGQVDAVLQVQADENAALASHPVVSQSADAVLAAAGSRYATCASLASLPALLATGARLALAMKPCDIAGLRNLQGENPQLREQVPITIALFCGTVPGLAASDAFLARRGLSRDDVTAFRWRGHGCPGPTWARTRDGREVSGDYAEFWVDNPWGTQFRCKICPDAVGLQADIAVGDAWPGGWPEGEDEGWNSMIAHTEAGAALLAEAEAAGRIYLEDADVDLLNETQPHHVTLRQMLAARLAAARLAGLPEPNFQGLGLNAAAADVDADALGENFAGTLKRLRAGHGDEGVAADYSK